MSSSHDPTPGRHRLGCPQARPISGWLPASVRVHPGTGGRHRAAETLRERLHRYRATRAATPDELGEVAA